MLDIIRLIIPIFITILLGYLTVSFGLLNKDHFKAIELFVIKVALPCMLIVSISSQDFTTLLQVPYLVSFGLASFIVFSIALFIYFKLFKQSLTHASVMAMGSSMSNTGFIGSGLLYLFLGEKAAIYFGMSFLLENFIVFLLFLICLEIGKSKTTFKNILKSGILSIIQNPIVIALFLGFLFSACDIVLPHILIKVLQPIGQTAMPLGLLVIGGSLYGISIASQNNLARDAMILSTLKLVLMPLLVYSLFLLFPSADAEMIFAGTLLASVSMIGIFAVFGQQYEMQKVPAILLICTLCSILSLSTVIHFLHI